METQKDLGSLLLEEGLITADQLAAARTMQASRDKPIGRVLTDMGLITEPAKMAFLRKKFRYEIVSIRDVVIPPEVLSRLTLSYAEKHCCVPLLVENRRLVVAMEDPTDLQVTDEIKLHVGMDILPVLAPRADIEHAIEQYPRLTQAQADAIMLKARRPWWVAPLHPILFWAVIIAPLFAFGAAVALNDQFGNSVNRLGEPFDISLYLVLSWALWAIFVWEIDGLFFGPKKTEG
jgi:hypothetical protein